ncbi:Oxidoreductase AflY [Diaporthe amygdali]|uniref:Oxidoreductase AflY n=1 Tax=Phomopsis amygdali TaxID=1214568 RepID=UPI0022FDC1EA|nr:Oxidoreductase AflY [Diaporthe amygdali]KAJ0107607.1 Oxidoreductase AflY [Diaporthe amygdali]
MANSEGFRLTSGDLGLGRLDVSPPGCIDLVNDLLVENHKRWHMYFRDVAGHNHIPHAILSALAMGGTPQDLRRAYDDGENIQRPMPVLDHQTVKELSNPTGFRAHMQVLDQYPNFLVFFEQEIAAKGYEAVINDYCLSRTPLADLMLAQLYEGLYHPIIHLGFGVEFNLPGLVAEGLAQTASHDPMYIDVFFQRAEAVARSGNVAPRPLVELYHEVRANEAIRTAARLPDGPWKVRDGVLGRSLDEIVAVAAQFRVPEASQEAVERATAEMISCAAWTCAAAHKPGRERKIDFFLMHNVTSSLFLTVLARQPWITLADKVRLVEWKARLDLVWYAASAAPELRDEHMTSYEATLSAGMGWSELYQALNKHHDDGHVAKFVRALKNGEDATKPFEKEDVGAIDPFPVKGDLWLKIAQMCYDSTVMYVDGQKKWVWGAGFDKMWDNVPEFLREN